jgi:serine/threonine-protein kinase
VELSGRGACWRCRGTSAHGNPTRGFTAGWCNGSAGFTLLWALAHQVLGDGAWRQLAIDSAWGAWSMAEEYPHLCCGLAGRAYAMVSAFRLTGETAWLERARILGARAAARVTGNGAAPYANSLFRGDVGIAVLAAELERPEAAALPFFEDEGWPRS